MRATFLIALALLAACSEAQRAPEHGALWPHRERVAEALTFRKGQLSAAVGKAARPCIHYWMTGEPDLAEIAPAECADRARKIRPQLSRYLGVDATLDDVRDPALWRYVAERTKP